MKFTFIINIDKSYIPVLIFSSENWTGTVYLSTSLKKIGVQYVFCYNTYTNSEYSKLFKINR